MRQLAATLSTLFALTAPLAAQAAAPRPVDGNAVANEASA